MRNSIKRQMLLLTIGLLAVGTASGQSVSWQNPVVIERGQSGTIYYDAWQGSLPASATGVSLRWSVDYSGSGAWEIPPEEIRPAGSMVMGDILASPMQSEGDAIWSIDLETLDTIHGLRYDVAIFNQTDDNGGDHWVLPLRTPTVTEQSVIFVCDPRSARMSVQEEDIEDIYIAGPFNNWSTSADRMLFRDEYGYYTYELTMPVGQNLYKFVVNGDVWIKDPDNPVSEGVDNDNSIVNLYPYEAPRFVKVRPVDQRVVQPDTSITFQAYVRTSGYANGLLDNPTMTIDGTNAEFTWVSSLNLLFRQFAFDEGIHQVEMNATDDAELSVTKRMTIAFHDPADGYLSVDIPGDDVGPGSYRYPENLWGAADLTSFRMTEANGGNAIEFEVALARIEPETRVLLQISDNLLGAPVDPSAVATEMGSPEWNGVGLQMILADPTSADFDEELHNRLITSRQPMEVGNSFTVDMTALEDDVFQFTINVYELEAILGSFNHPWYFGGYSFLDGPEGTVGHAWEVDAAHGGSDDAADPDAFDALFVDQQLIQNKLFGYYSGNNHASLDNVGRGFALISPEEIGANVGSQGPVVRLLTGGGTTSHPVQEVVGIVEFADQGSVSLYQDYDGGQDIWTFEAVTDTFRLPEVTLYEGANYFHAVATEGEESSFTTQMVYTLEVNHRPVPGITASVEGNTVTLDASASVDPDGEGLEFTWFVPEGNPAPLTINNANSAIATCTAPDTPGEYYIQVAIVNQGGFEKDAKTFFTVSPDSVHPFDTDEAASWVKDAIIYSIYPRGFTENFTLQSAIDALPGLSFLGVNTIWFTPIYPSPTGHGYEITDYRNIHPDFGTLDDFQELVSAAHDLGIKIVLDLVFNHTALAHPFFQNTVIYDEFSHYYDWYMRDPDGNYQYYFNWATLPNLNLDNDEAAEYFIETSEWWVENFDVDGFRCDVAWGVQERHPDFWVDWRNRLKTIRPEILLLGEANAREEVYFDNRFDLVYDWYLHHEASRSLVTMFDGDPRPSELHDAIENAGDGFEPYKLPFRFLENHDEDRYIANHTPEQTKLATSLLMTIPGVPMIYAGQEYGEQSRRLPFEHIHRHGIYELTYRLVWARRRLPSLTSPNIDFLTNSRPNDVYAYARYQEGEVPVVVVHNFRDETLSNVSLTLPTGDWGIEAGQQYYLNELLRNTHDLVMGSDLASLSFDLDPYQSVVLAIGTELISVDAPERASLPESYQLEQNYPNPFNPETTIRFSLPTTSHVRLVVYNVLGQNVRTLIDRPMTAGEHMLNWDGRSDADRALASGVYFYRMEAGSYQSMKKMILLK